MWFIHFFLKHNNSTTGKTIIQIQIRQKQVKFYLYGFVCYHLTIRSTFLNIKCLFICVKPLLVEWVNI